MAMSSAQEAAVDATALACCSQAAIDDARVGLAASMSAKAKAAGHLADSSMQLALLPLQHDALLPCTDLVTWAAAIASGAAAKAASRSAASRQPATKAPLQEDPSAVLSLDTLPSVAQACQASVVSSLPLTSKSASRAVASSQPVPKAPLLEDPAAILSKGFQAPANLPKSVVRVLPQTSKSASRAAVSSQAVPKAPLQKDPAAIFSQGSQALPTWPSVAQACQVSVVSGLPRRGVALFHGSPGDAQAFLDSLSGELEDHPSGTCHFENIDVSNVAWDQTPGGLAALLDILEKFRATSQRFKAFKCRLGDEEAVHMAHWQAAVPAEELLLEVHLSHNDITTAGFTTLVQVFDEKSATAKLRHPVWFRVEGNMIDPACVSSLVSYGRCCLAEGGCSTRYCEAASRMPLYHMKFGTHQRPAAGKTVAPPIQGNRRVATPQAARAVVTSANRTPEDDATSLQLQCLPGESPMLVQQTIALQYVSSSIRELQVCPGSAPPRNGERLVAAPAPLGLGDSAQSAGTKVDAESERREGNKELEKMEGGAKSTAAAVPQTEQLPSLGSAQHFAGECKRCAFFSKGYCRKGKDCTFCHFPHDKRRPKRQERRDRPPPRASARRPRSESRRPARSRSRTARRSSRSRSRQRPRYRARNRSLSSKKRSRSKRWRRRRSIPRRRSCCQSRSSSSSTTGDSSERRMPMEWLESAARKHQQQAEESLRLQERVTNLFAELE
mmetsp:Transcript_20296/g.38404  ORF Transcript_20296/g.38404 Transcript_20296/m.38404 type:complete len:727 (+) Transcript_20296:78-2258(+)